jgi:glycopeptide antibiotics resistance protein
VPFGALAGSALAVAISLTLFRGGGQPWSLLRLRGCVVTDPTVLSGDALGNLALFAPAAFFAVLAIGRPARVAAAVAAVSLGVEGLQAIRSVGVCDSSDALLNALGGLAAALVAASLRSALRLRRPIPHASVPGSNPCPRSC